MTRSTGYEWDIETVTADEHEDIVDHDHRERMHDFGGEKLTLALVEDGDEPGTFFRLCLVRSVWDDVTGLVDRSWAYVEDGKMPTHFENGVVVPKRFHDEFNL